MKLFKKNLFFIFSVTLLCATYWYYTCISSTDHLSDIRQTEKFFLTKEEQLDSFLKQIVKQISNGQWPKDTELHPFYISIYRHDSLIFWNNNTVPIPTLTPSYFLASGLTKTQNGWYFAKTIEHELLTISVSFLVKREYAYQNEYLKNTFAFPSIEKMDAYLSLDEEVGYPIYSKNKQYCFSIVIPPYQALHSQDVFVLSCLILLTLVAFCGQISIYLQNYSSKLTYLFPVFLLVIRYLSLHFSWFSVLQHTEFFQANLYGTSFFFPSFFDYLLNVFLVLIIFQFYYGKLKFIRYKNDYLLPIFCLIFFFFVWDAIVYLFRGLIENSTIPLRIDRLFSLNSYSLLAILSIAVLGFSYFIAGKTLVRMIKNARWTMQKTINIAILIGGIYIFFTWCFLRVFSFSSLFPIFFLVLICLLEYRDFQQKHLILGMSLLILYAWECTFIMYQFNEKKEKIDRELYASQLITERDINTELEYDKLAATIRTDKFIQRIISSKYLYRSQDFEQQMENRHFNAFWERYECQFFLFNQDKNLLLATQQNNQAMFKRLNEIIEKHAEKSPINDAIFFVKDYTDQYSYIIREQVIGKNQEIASLFITLKSKKIPEEIGFPRLLISSQTVVMEHLENYTIARYHRGKLISNYGNFPYPTHFSAFKKCSTNRENKSRRVYFDYQGFNHLMYSRTAMLESDDDVVVLSTPNTTNLDRATSFSYLFCFFGILLLPIYVRLYARVHTRNNWSLSTKIRLILLGLVLTALVISGIGSAWFINNQSQEYVHTIIGEKMNAIEQQIRVKLAENNSDYNTELAYLSNIFKTDINIYDTNAYLLGTSRPKVFNIGLLSEQMNPIAKKEIFEQKQKQFIHREHIGSLYYHSAYANLYNENGDNKLCINLQYFGQQQQAEQQLYQYIEAVINIFVLLIAISTSASIILSNWITNPLRMLQEHFARIKIDNNEPINYHRNDEIGDLIAGYNQKIEELKVALQQMSQQQRELAWREFAQQIAHEIKNPLTPMKLSVQYLLQTSDRNDPQIENKIKKIGISLIEQIDVITRIVNEFATFAKIPQPYFQTTDIIPLIKNITEIFQQSSTTRFLLNIPTVCLLEADKSQLTQAFNNLFKNSLQAGASKIVISVDIRQAKVQIQIADNGKGMSEEEKKQVFIPHFTTKTTGSGIGLALVKQIITNHNGIISFESTQNKGTTFHIELPIKSIINLEK